MSFEKLKEVKTSKDGPFDPESYKLPGEVFYKGVMYNEPFFGPSTIKYIPDFKGDSKDVMLASYPKTGITWMSGVISLIFNDGDVEKANAQGGLDERLRYLEFAMPMQPRELEIIAATPPPRSYKTHLPYELVQKQIEEDKVRTIVMLRNPKDTIVSYFHYYRMNRTLGMFDRDFHDFFLLFKANRLVNGDIFQWYKDWWVQKDRENIKFVRYEDMKLDPKATVSDIAKFCGKELSDITIDNIVAASSMKEMRKNPTTNFKDAPVFDQKVSSFYRKGEVGDWKNYFSDEESEYVDKKCEEILTPIGLTFNYE